MKVHFKPHSYFVISFVVTLGVLGLLYFTSWKWSYYKEWRAIQRSLLFKVTKKRTFSIAELMGPTNVEEVVKPNKSTILMEPSMPFVEASPDSNRRPLAVILVTSMVKFFHQRHTIRNTWYRWAKGLNVRVFFMIGFHDFNNQMDLLEILEDEQRIHNDLIVDEYEEGYYKLPGKILRMLKWYNSTYTEENAPRFFIKTDQDVFIHLPNLVRTLKNTAYYQNLALLSQNVSENSTGLADEVNYTFDPADPESYFVGGKKFENAPVESDPDSKWYIDSSERERMGWSGNFFPTYANGPCYILSGNVVKSIYEASFNVPIYPFEDVYIVGLIAYDRLNLYISNVDGMMLDRSGLCNIKNRWKLARMVALHPVEHPLVMKKVCRKIVTCREFLGPSKSQSVALKQGSVSALAVSVMLLGQNFLI